MRVLIENEAGSRTKNTYDERTLAFVRSAQVSAAYPFPYGFAVGTKSGDGDAVDCFVLTDEPLKLQAASSNASRSRCSSRSRMTRSTTRCWRLWLERTRIWTTRRWRR